MSKNTNSKRAENSKVMIGYQKQDMFGYRLEKKKSYQCPFLSIGNNMYKNHSHISKDLIFRPFKGPLYNEAGRICIGLTDKYVPLETFIYQTKLESMKH